MDKCKTCYGFGMWAIGDPSPMGPGDAGCINPDKPVPGYPTIPCPSCGANANPIDEEEKKP